MFKFLQKLAQLYNLRTPLPKSVYKSQGSLSLLSAGGEVRDQDAKGLNRFAVITYVHNDRKWVYSARRHNSITSSYICQLQQQQGLFELY